MISLILPKLIRSVARDGIFGFLLGTATRRTEIVYSTTQGKPAAFKHGQLANPISNLLLFIGPQNYVPQFTGEKGATAKRRRPGIKPIT